MAPSLSKNAVIGGYVDYFCLICESYLKNEDETILHISEESHQNNLKATSYVHDYKEDYIKKINNRYFCELCNRVLSVLAKVRIHVTEPLHLDKKKSHVFKRRNNNVIAFDKVVINERSWHGMNEANSCAICSLEYDDEKKHKAEATHVIKLIETTVEFDGNGNLYRKIEDTFQCLTCDMVGALNDLMAHFDKTEHKKKYQECCKLYKTLFETKSDKSCIEKNSKQTINNESNQNDKEKEVIKPNNEIKRDKSEIMPKERNTSQSNEQNTTRKINKPVKYIFDEDCEQEICKVLNTTDYITRDENGRMWCILCNWIMNPQKIPHHLNGKHHQTILKFHRERIEKFKNINKISKQLEENIKSESVNDNSMLLNSVDEFQKNGITINFESKVASCKKCSSILDYNYDAIDSHIKGHSKVSKKQNKPVNLLTGNVKVGENKNMLFTSPVNLKKNKKKGKTDTKNDIKKCTNNEIPIKDVQIVKKIINPVLQKVLFNEFIEIAAFMKNHIFNDIVINNKFVINVLSFGCITEKNNVFECYICGESFANENILEHIQCLKHMKKFDDMYMIVMDSELIREVKPDKFHCGFCNTVETSWEEMQAHVKTSSHKEAKNAAEWRLPEYKTEMASQDFQTRLETATKINAEFFKSFF